MPPAIRKSRSTPPLSAATNGRRVPTRTAHQGGNAAGPGQGATRAAGKASGARHSAARGK